MMIDLGYNYKNAGFVKRFTAFYLTLLFIFLGTALVCFILLEQKFLGLELTNTKFWLAAILIFFFFVLTDTFFQNIFSANLAKRLLGLKVVDKNTNQNLSFISALIRTITGFFSFLFLGLGFLAIAFNKDSLAMHDLMSGSKVIEKQRGPILGLFTNIFTWISFLAGSLVLIAFVSSLLLAPLSAGKSFYSMAKYSKYDLTDFETRKTFNMKISNDRVFAFVYSPTPDNVDFELDPSVEHSSLSHHAAKKLGLGAFDYYLVVNNWSDDLTKISIAPQYLAPHLILKNLDSKDLDLFDFKFELSNKSVIGYDLLSVFDFNIDEQKDVLTLKPYRGDALVINNPDYDLEAKQYLVYMLRKTREDWKNYLRQSSPETIEVLEDINHELRNTISLNIDTETGYVMKATLLKPTKVEEFDALAEKFLTGIERLRMVPDSLKVKQTITIEMDLVYQELI